MLTEQIQAAMREAQYQRMKHDRFFGAVPSCQGVWSEGPTVESCRAELQSTLEDWHIIKPRIGAPIPASGARASSPDRRMPKPMSRRAMIRRFRALGWEGPVSGRRPAAMRPAVTRRRFPTRMAATLIGP